MVDERVRILAKNLLTNSVKLQKGEKVLIDLIGNDCESLGKELIKQTYELGGIPFFTGINPIFQREFLMNANEEQLKMLFNNELEFMKNIDAYIAVRASNNITELSDVPSNIMKMYMKCSEELTNERVNNTKWCILRYPNPSMAQLSSMSTEKFENLFFDVCNLDYAKMDIAMDPLKELMDKTDKVRITGPNTDLSFSIKGIGSKKCAGECNIPDGEVYSAPVKTSVNGIICYNVPSLNMGNTFTNIKLEFKDGKIINATSNNTDKLNEIFDTDEGARYVGEFAIGVNPYVVKPMNDILFDEKIMGSFHFTPGRCYDDVSNGNDSAIHWDLVCIQTNEYGGGEIYFDDILIRKDGIFILDELKCLNPENLK